MKQNKIDCKKADAIIRDIPKGIIGWYDFSNVESALYIGEKIDALCEELSNRVQDTVCVSPDKLITDEASNLSSYDFILCSAIFEKIEVPANLFGKLTDCLNPNGHFFITMNNRLGIRNFCGDRDPYTNRSFDGVEGYRRAYVDASDSFNGRCYSRAELNDILKESGFDNYNAKFYSVYPSIDEPTFIYADGYVPNEDLSNRIHPSYNYPQSVFLDEEFLYNDLVKNGLFNQLANGFLIEITKEGELSHVQHVTNSIERGHEDALYTIITDGEVIKKAVYPEGNRRLVDLNKNMTRLSELGAYTVGGRLKEDELCEYTMPFINAPTTQKYLKSLASKGNREAFIEVLEKFRDIILEIAEPANEVEVEAWKRDMDDIRLDFDLGPILKNVFIDMVPLNSFYQDGKFIFIDQEFCMDVCPLKVLIYRMIATLYSGDASLRKVIPMEDLLKRFDVYDHREEWALIEWKWLGKLWNKDELATYHGKNQKNWQAIGSNRQRMNYSQEKYEQLFVNVFDNADSRKLILFGSGNFTKNFLMIYKKDYPVYAIIDNRQDKWGQELDGVKIYSPDILKEFEPAEYKVIICIKSYQSVVKQLDELGVGGYSIYDPGREYVRPLKPISQGTMTENGDSEAVKKKYHVGYVAGAFDMFHLGHLNLLRRAKEQCDYLIVGIISDDTMERKKNKRPIIPEDDRCEIVASCRYVDQAEVLPERYNDIIEAYKMFHFDVQFSGNDHADDPGWIREREYLESRGADIVFFPYTEKVSSTKLRDELQEK